MGAHTSTQHGVCLLVVFVVVVMMVVGLRDR